jgi:hypothetical protein
MAKARSQVEMWKQPKAQAARCPSNFILRFVRPANTALSTYPSLFILKPLFQTPVSRTTNLMQKLLKVSSGTALVGAKLSPPSQPASFRRLSESPAPDHLLSHGCHRQHLPEIEFRVLRHHPTRQAFHSVKARARNSEGLT